IRHGYVVLDAYYYPYTADMKHQLWSVTKSFTGTLVGIAIDQGLIEGIDQPVLELFPGYTPADSTGHLDQLTVGNLLTMSSGLPGSDSLGVSVEAEMIAEPDAVGYLLNLPISGVRGSVWQYNNLNSDMLTAAVESTAGISFTEFAEVNLFQPLGITDYVWTPYEGDIAFGGFGLWLTPPDMARLGYLYLHQGMWADKQVVASDWVDLSHCVDLDKCPFDDAFGSVGYGYHWWIFQPSFYTAVGAYGQAIAVAPDFDTVVVITSSNIPGSQNPLIFENLIPNRILAAARSESPLPANESAQSALAARVQSLAQPEPTAASPLPAIANEISGQTYDLLTSIYLDPSPDLAEYLFGRTMEVTAFTLNFPNDAEAQLDLDFADGYRVNLPVGLDGVWRTTDSEFGPMAARGGWDETGNRFAVDYQIVGAANCGRFTFRINDEGALNVVWENLASPVGTLVRRAQTEIHDS
ncbi:MAG: beta-lactamase family protein, partial [Anaerolineae bacterium]|nr:beta-lactamase family protein [Anaerolineae bacterium]